MVDCNNLNVDRQEDRSEAVERCRPVELERGSGELRHLQEFNQLNLSGVPGCGSGRHRVLHDFLGSLQPCLPHALHKPLDDAEEEHLSVVPESMEYGEDRQGVIVDSSL